MTITAYQTVYSHRPWLACTHTLGYEYGRGSGLSPCRMRTGIQLRERIACPFCATIGKHECDAFTVEVVKKKLRGELTW